MPMERMAMRQVRDCVRLKNAGMSTREIAWRVGVAASTVRLTLRRCEASGITRPVDASLTDAMLEQRQFASSRMKPGHRQEKSRSVIAAFEPWLIAKLGLISQKTKLAEAIRYALSRGDGRHPRLLRNLRRADLLILDNWGLEPLNAAARHDLLEILEDRYGRRSTMIASQLPVDRWHEIIGEPRWS